MFKILVDEFFDGYGFEDKIYNSLEEAKQVAKEMSINYKSDHLIVQIISGFYSGNELNETELQESSKHVSE